MIQSLSETNTLPLIDFHQGIIRNLIQTNLARFSTHQTFSNYLTGNPLAVKTILHPAAASNQGLEISLVLLPAEKAVIQEAQVLEILDGVLGQVQNTLGYFGLRFDQGLIGGRLLVQKATVQESQVEDLGEWIKRLNHRKSLIAIANELVRMARVETEMKQGKSPTDIELSKSHIKTLKDVIKMIGWPTRAKVGNQASHSSWLLALQADFDREFQKEALQLISQDQEAEKSEIAYLTDRIRVLEGEKQLYGTQYQVDKDGNIAPLPIHKFEKVNERRKEMGLESFEKYLEVLKESLGTGEK